MDNLGLVPLMNFAEIVPNLYRSAQPLFAYQYQWINNVLRVDTIVNLRSESTMDETIMHQIHLGITPVQFAVKDHHAPTLEMVKDYQELIKESLGNGHKTLIHCLHGHGRTSTFSVLAKMALGWSVDAAIRDEHDRFHFHFKHREQERFLRSLAD